MIGMGSTKPRDNVEAVREFSVEEALAWLAKYAPLVKTAVELSRVWGWKERRTQRQINRWLEQGMITKKAGVIRVKASTPIEVEAPLAPHERNVNETTAPNAFRHWMITVIVLVSIGALNSWPRIRQLFTGESDAAGWSLVVFQFLNLFVMTQIPFAYSRRGRTFAGKTALVALAAFLVVANMVFSVEAIGHVRDAARDRNRAVEQAASSVKRQLDAFRAEKATVPAFTPTSEDAVTAAKRTVEEASTARDQECGKVGDNCRKRVADLVVAESTLKGLQADKAAQDRSFTLDLKISKLEEELRSAGPVPLTADPAAARISALTFGLVPPEATSLWLPTLLSFVAEILALIGPFVLEGAFADLQPARSQPANSRPVARQTSSTT